MPASSMPQIRQQPVAETKSVPQWEPERLDRIVGVILWFTLLAILLVLG